MYYLAFISSAIRPFNHEEIQEILNAGQRNNSKNDITGLLLYQSGNMLQYIEGPKEKVIETFNRISRDPRHHQVMNVLQGEIEERLFSDYSMGFKDLSDVSNVKEYREFLGNKLSLHNLDSSREKILKFIRTFARINQ